ncbi:MAG: 16S rRNA (uracil(1498)-N(3))-methyltransferase [Ignavibacteriae bacterium]|nr:16S rRNA (uracil(1498)-N(3))-methyltransferase [Ignavibacteriota bacterium]NOG98713.1 16S rRNA (uracil(1498)-N(3))-methyltransferase [Ignavibacteriota bacterium]
MDQDFLSNIELYYSPSPIKNDVITIDGDEFKHLTKVMRHNSGDTIYVTTGSGVIYKSEIINITKVELNCRIIENYIYKDNFKNIVFCLPLLKSTDRFEFALEKSVELGITNIIVYKAERSVAKGNKLERWNKIALAAMKQSLRSYLPKIEFKESLKEINNFEGDKILFDQNFVKSINWYADNLSKHSSSSKQYFIFGPEGGLTDNEIQTFSNPIKLKLAANRLRSESAAVYAAAILNSFLVE